MDNQFLLHASFTLTVDCDFATKRPHWCDLTKVIDKTKPIILIGGRFTIYFPEPCDDMNVAFKSL